MPFLERRRDRYGKRFTMRLLQTPPFVHHSEPEHLREIFTAPPEVLHPGEGARILEPVVGSNSVILLDERPHLSQRKLMLPAFHGEKMQRLSGLVEEVAEREVATGRRMSRSRCTRGSRRSRSRSSCARCSGSTRASGSTRCAPG